MKLPLDINLLLKSLESSGVSPSSSTSIPKPPQSDSFGELHDKVRGVADGYADTVGLSLTHGTPKPKVNPAEGKRIADVHESAQHAPDDEGVKASYDALINETVDQYHHIMKTGLKTTKMRDDQPNPYAGGSKELFRDLHQNNHMHYYPTSSGFGTNEQSIQHPMLQPTNIMDDEGKPMLANDVFRIVHDYFGHAKEGNSFGPNGEEAAWEAHSAMYSPTARPAMTVETKMQNHWVNLGPHGEHNRANPNQTIFAEQKAYLPPEDIVNHRYGRGGTVKQKAVVFKSFKAAKMWHNPDPIAYTIDSTTPEERKTYGEESRYIVRDRFTQKSVFSLKSGPWSDGYLPDDTYGLDEDGGEDGSEELVPEEDVGAHQDAAQAGRAGQHYTYNPDGRGGVVIYDPKGTDVGYLQGDEANELMRQVGHIEDNAHRYPHGPFDSAEQHISAILDQYAPEDDRALSYNMQDEADEDDDTPGFKFASTHSSEWTMKCFKDFLKEHKTDATEKELAEVQGTGKPKKLDDGAAGKAVKARAKKVDKR
jgi:hypothetical protein